MSLWMFIAVHYFGWLKLVQLARFLCFLHLHLFHYRSQYCLKTSSSMTAWPELLAFPSLQQTRKGLELIPSPPWTLHITPPTPLTTVLVYSYISSITLTFFSATPNILTQHCISTLCRSTKKATPSDLLHQHFQIKHHICRIVPWAVLQHTDHHLSS